MALEITLRTKASRFLYCSINRPTTLNLLHGLAKESPEPPRASVRAGGKIDRALNWILGFEGQDARIAYLTDRTYRGSSPSEQLAGDGLKAAAGLGITFLGAGLLCDPGISPPSFLSYTASAILAVAGTSLEAGSVYDAVKNVLSPGLNARFLGYSPRTQRILRSSVMIGLGLGMMTLGAFGFMKGAKFITTPDRTLAEVSLFIGIIGGGITVGQGIRSLFTN